MYFRKSCLAHGTLSEPDWAITLKSWHSHWLAPYFSEIQKLWNMVDVKNIVKTYYFMFFCINFAWFYCFMQRLKVVPSTQELHSCCIWKFVKLSVMRYFFLRPMPNICSFMYRKNPHLGNYYVQSLILTRQNKVKVKTNKPSTTSFSRDFCVSSQFQAFRKCLRFCNLYSLSYL